MARKQKNKKVVKMSRPHSINIGVVVFVTIILYVIFNIYSYLTSDTVAEYEVSQGAIAANHVYRGLILRDETIVYAGQSGYINYYLKNGSKASVNDVVYSIDTDGDLSRQITTAVTDGTTLSQEMLLEMAEEIDLFRNNYTSGHFSDVYAFKNRMDADLSQTLGVGALKELSDVVDSAEANKTFYRKKSDDTGIIVYYTDGYENVTPDKVRAELMSAASYKKIPLDTQTEVSAGDAVYKRINSEEWQVVLSIPEETAARLEGKNYVRIRFCKDDYEITVPFDILLKGEDRFLTLSLQTAMIRYAGDRFVDVELILSEENGLKIPNSAITSKEFFTVPKEYFTEDGGLLVQRADQEVKGEQVELVHPTIYYETETHYYIDSEYVAADDRVIRSDSAISYPVGQEVDSLTGVYNINKGYAVFKQINIISQNETYAVVETKTAYGIALYDHIALDGSKIRENQLIAR